MGIITRMRKQGQFAVYWERLGIDAFGKPTYKAPIEMEVRFQDSNEEFIDNEGDRQISRAKVFPDRFVQLNDVLMEGKLVDLVDPLNPKKNPGAWEVRKSSRIPNLRNKEILFIALL